MLCAGPACHGAECEDRPPCGKLGSMTERLFKLVRWTATLLATAALTTAGPALGATSRQSFYSGTGVTNTGSKAKLKMGVTRFQGGKVRVTILKATDGCFGASTEGSRSRVHHGHFAISFVGGTQAAGFSAELDGDFTNARSASVKMHTGSWYFPAGGSPSTCQAKSTIEIHKL
jgi:hypothetical protein